MEESLFRDSKSLLNIWDKGILCFLKKILHLEMSILPTFLTINFIRLIRLLDSVCIHLETFFN